MNRTNECGNGFRFKNSRNAKIIIYKAHAIDYYGLIVKELI